MAASQSSEKVSVEVLEDGALWRLLLNAPRANILDAPMLAALKDVFARARGERHLKALLIEGQGSDFSFGASVEEHLIESVAGMLHAFHEVFMAAFACSLPCLAVVRGRCLGGGLELATFCHRIFASTKVSLGQPEILLGVFAPVASLLLAHRVGRTHAEDLCLTGRTVKTPEALAMGLVDEVCEDPLEAALAYARHYFLPRSASSLRFAVRALRQDLQVRFERGIRELEQLYLSDLMATRDASEGLQAFLDKRDPCWEDA